MTIEKNKLLYKKIIMKYQNFFQIGSISALIGIKKSLFKKDLNFDSNFPWLHFPSLKLSFWGNQKELEHIKKITNNYLQNYKMVQSIQKKKMR